MFIQNLHFLESQLHAFSNPERLQAIFQGAPFHASELREIVQLTGIPAGRLLEDDLKERQASPTDLKLIVFDVDGVMTDAGMYYTEQGDEFKKFNARDGLAIRALRMAGYETAIISHGINENLIRRRAELLLISNVYCGAEPKNEVLARWCQQLNISFKQTAFIGDDANDLPIIRVVGFSACPSDAMEVIKNEVDVVLKLGGGKGCIREWADRFLLNAPLGEEI